MLVEESERMYSCRLLKRGRGNGQRREAITAYMSAAVPPGGPLPWMMANNDSTSPAPGIAACFLRPIDADGVVGSSSERCQPTAPTEPRSPAHQLETVPACRRAATRPLTWAGRTRSSEVWFGPSSSEERSKSWPCRIGARSETRGPWKLVGDKLGPRRGRSADTSPLGRPTLDGGRSQGVRRR